MDHRSNHGQPEIKHITIYVYVTAELTVVGRKTKKKTCHICTECTPPVGLLLDDRERLMLNWWRKWWCKRAASGNTSRCGFVALEITRRCVCYRRRRIEVLVYALARPTIAKVHHTTRQRHHTHLHVRCIIPKFAGSRSTVSVNCLRKTRSSTETIISVNTPVEKDPQQKQQKRG